MKLSSRALETIVGAIVLIIMINFSIVLYKEKKIGSSDLMYSITASFDRIDGVNIGTPVVVSGIKVGQVIEQRLDKENYSAQLTFEIDENVKLPVDTLAEIVSSSLLGDKYVSLVPGSDTEVLKQDDKIEFTQSSISFESLISKMLFGMDSNKSKDGAKSDGDDHEENGGIEGEAADENDKSAFLFNNSNVG